MTGDPRTTSLQECTDFTRLDDIPAWIPRAYTATYRGPHGDAPETERQFADTAVIQRAAVKAVTPALLSAHFRLAQHRRSGETRVAVYTADDPAGFGPAMQVVTEQGGMLMDSVAVLLHRLGVAYVGIMNPIFVAHRSPTGELQSIGSIDAERPPDGVEEMWIHVQLSPSVNRKALAEAERLLPSVLGDVRQVAADATAMITALDAVAHDVEANEQGHYSAPDREDVAALLRWLADGHFVLLGYQRGPISDGQVSVDESSRLGVLRLRKASRPRLTEDGKLLVLAQATTPSYVRFGAYPYVVVIRENAQNTVVEHRFVGLFTVAAMNANVLEIPLVARQVQKALALAERDPSHPGQLLLDIIQTVPRSELFALDAERLLEMATAVVDLGSRRRALLFLRADRLGQLVSCLVYLPRDRYTTAVRLEMQDILVRELGGSSLEYTARVSEAPWAVVHFVVRLPDRSSASAVDTSDENKARIQALLTEATRTWADRLMGAVQTGAIAQSEAEHYADAFSEAYKQVVSPADAIKDIAVIESLTDDSVKLVFADRDEGDGIALLTWYLGGRTASLSRLLPMLQSMGVVVLEERPFTVTRPDGLVVWIYQFKIKPHPTIRLAPEGPEREATAQRFADAVTAIWQGRAEIDRFNELVLRAGLTWHQVVVLRAYAKYLRQAAFPYSQAHIESILNENPKTAAALVALFEALFDPDPSGSRESRDAQAAAAAVAADIDALQSLDTDRVLRAFASLIQATLRTNYFVTKEGSARSQNALAVKLDAQLIDELPLPRPKFEIFVYSPRVEGVHLRFGHVARGGLRWSDRREDFRTEILGLVKAQAVKNAVIVPVGAKGGFVVKRPPLPTGDAAADRDAAREEGIACYKLFISGLLEITDNVDHSTGEVRVPPQVVRRDGDDAYLVVAADKGTAAFSDIANDIAKSYGFWLGDAFASGGSVGYDHKAMGITARGAWEAVKRHFREMGVDTQSEDFTVVGIGDMSGDVFGNGMLLSKHIRLVAAFDHRHVFLDPNPDAAASWQERRRLFELPRSSWADYDTSLISEGGGVFSREHKTIPISDQVRATLGIEDDVSEMAPPNLVRAILKAPVDLLYNGGIGTYVKAEAESDSEVGDRANDQVRVNANQLRAKVVAEGGNLGVTARGRIEFDLCGGRINTDAMDNSAGVDCSDHEVNIKILIDALITAGKIKPEERTGLLESMTDEVAELVLTDNVDQNDLLGTSRANAASLLPVHADLIKYLVAERGLNRELEALPSEKEIHRRAEAGLGLTSPELATLMAHVKLALKDELLATDLPDQEVFASRLPQYFPSVLRDRFGGEIRSHQLRREIVTTMLVNDLVDTGGITYAYRVTQDVGVGPVDAVRAYVATDAIFGVGELRRQIRAADLPVTLSDRLTLDTRRLIDRAARWLLNYRPQPLAVGAEVNRFAKKVQELTPRMSEWLRGDDKAIVEKEAAEFASQGASEELAYMVAIGLYRYSLLDIIDIADIDERDAAEVADTYFALMDRLGTDGLLTAVSELPRDDRWHSLARLAIRDDIYASLRALCFDVLAVGEPDESGEEKIAEWEHTSASRVERARRTLTEIYESGAKDLATLSVAARQIRRMTRTSGRGSSG
ncbi:NAD-glutamate dehydrogenase [Mycobacterium shimoidei]|uniref:Putative NAD-dependent glutamate dehydrogenase Gdh (NAD-Gdh) (NAD-dependent glutamic dehydrogenase) [Mycobacterium tuberculosis H37Rv] n=1 Tax=Mycobacterium shimoidei TaxID=29313 RepID=A0A1E3TKS0_MYCSH|nr:NAD-glutamate dehydrogenase [Mycobacterium shimoidei]MCV7259912.1 NAD-glutamate dehydrogenase [Mycobacterium shimoidei]ODR15044.1 NAD-glutamate dehydrogenase [Mycobacterium shimoidei]ORW79209.1 NAD-glutamate dehydrogenase [Mycobacterium shimoidei]SRX94540.1 putative NAD-dependent glutamate dehydrogenase Gdh (NAD-Gdh) (NAD-dependent glutamic dehydrogenase) [Mycobacterium tuberculosis H37Rv] [Mycobacterium shimoidei]